MLSSTARWNSFQTILPIVPGNILQMLFPMSISGMCGASAAALRFSWVKHHCVSRTKKPSAIRSNIGLLVQLGLSTLKGIHLGKYFSGKIV
jgi:hypothetical protein